MPAPAPDRRETMWFEQSPDCYGGKTRDQIVPRWHCYADGDKDSDHQREPLHLDARRFPPGTKIVVSEPTCPNCGETRPLKFPVPKRGAMFEDKCRCGFDWNEWTIHQYS